MEFYLPIIWGGIIAVAVFLYVVLDGFDLGIGILFLSRESEDERDVMMNTVAPVWDGNETWLIIGGAGLMGTFPIAYATIMPALYLPLMIMLIALIFRGVAFEFRFKADRSRKFWDLAFFGGSFTATFFQGVNLGAFVQGIEVTEGIFTGGAFDWLTPFTILVGLSLLPGYALLGSTWLVMKTEGELQAHARHMANKLFIIVLMAMGAVSLWMVAFDQGIRERWFSLPNIFFLAPVPVLTAAVSFNLWRALRTGRETMPFVMAIVLFALGYIGLAVSRFPYVVPPSISIWDAAAAPKTQMFLLVGTLIILPVILAYTVYVYRVFRGKVRIGDGYH